MQHIEEPDVVEMDSGVGSVSKEEHAFIGTFPVGPKIRLSASGTGGMGGTIQHGEHSRPVTENNPSRWFAPRAASRFHASGHPP